VLESSLGIGSLWSRRRRPRRRGGAPPPHVCGVPGAMVAGLVALALLIVRVVCADCLCGLRTADAHRGLPVRIASADCGWQGSDFQLLDGWYICIIYIYVAISHRHSCPPRGVGNPSSPTPPIPLGAMVAMRVYRQQ